MLHNNPTSHSLSVFHAGKTDCVDIPSGNNFWTYDPYALRWRQHQTTGHVPPAEQACALTYANGNAYVLVMEEVHNTGLQLYELDLQRWIWRRLPVSDIPFYYDSTEDGGDTIATALVQVLMLTLAASTPVPMHCQQPCATPTS